MKTRDTGPNMAQRQPAAAPSEREPIRATSGAAEVWRSSLQGAINQSPRMVAQRCALRAAFGGAFQHHDDRVEDGAMLPRRVESDPVQLLGESPGSTEASAASMPVVGAGFKDTGIPSQLKVGAEVLSGMDLSDVLVHRNSAKPAQLNAFAYAQGNDIHLGPGQEQHLPHEAWHVVQQRQGRVRPSTQLMGQAINDDPLLEREATTMGEQALTVGQRRVAAAPSAASSLLQRCSAKENSTLQSHSLPVSSAVLQRDACYLPGQATPYDDLDVLGSVGPGEYFAPNQRVAVLDENREDSDNVVTFDNEVDIQRDDYSNGGLVNASTISEETAAVDHVVPAALGGCNTPQNAQVLSTANNSTKGDSYPWNDGYTGYRVYDLDQQETYDSYADAEDGGADMTTLDAEYPDPPG